MPIIRKAAKIGLVIEELAIHPNDVTAEKLKQALWHSPAVLLIDAAGHELTSLIPVQIGMTVFAVANWKPKEK